LCQEVQEMVQC